MIVQKIKKAPKKETLNENFQESLRNQIIDLACEGVRNGEIKNGEDVEDFLHNLLQPLYQKMLDTELTNMLEYNKYEHKEGENTNYRNGYCKPKDVQTKDGIITIRTPRDRKSEFEPQIIKKGENKLGKFEDIVLSMIAKGLSYRDIEKLLKDVYGVNITKDQVQNFLDCINEVTDKWRNRILKKCYVFTYADCLYETVFNGIKSEKYAFYVVIGVDVNGMKDILGVWCDKTESASFWTTVFEDLKARGVEDILFMTSDGVAGFQGSLETVFPKTQSQRCVVHLCRNLYKICPKKEASIILSAFKKIYAASNFEIAKLELENFRKAFSKLPAVVKKVEDDMQYIEPLFELPAEIRKAIYTSNSIESVNSALRKVTNGKGAFTSENAVFKLYYLRINELTEKWNKPIKNWKLIQAQLIELYGERYTKYLNI